MIIRQLKALWTMGLALLRKVLLLPFVRRPGPAPWLARLHEERLAATPRGAWERFERAGRCIGCGLCEAVPYEVVSPCTTVLSSSRRPEDAPLAVGEAEALRRLARDIARVCPARVGFDDVASLIEDNARMLASR